MNEQLQNQLATILGQIASGVKAAGDFTLSQLPDVAQQFVVYGRIKYTFLAMFFTVLCFLAFKWSISIRKSPTNRNRDGDLFEGSAVAIGALSVAGVGTGFLGLAFGMDAILVWSAPKVWLIKAVAELLK